MLCAGCVINPLFDTETEDTSADSPTATTDSGSSDPETDVDSDSAATSTGDDSPAPLEPCTPLMAPPEDAIVVGPGDVESLPGLVSAAAEGTTFVLEPGTYVLPSSLYVQTPGVTIRSSTGNPRDVVLDGRDQIEAVVSVRAPDVTVAELTITNPGDHHVMVSGDTVPADRMVAYRLRLLNPSLSAFKVNPNGEGVPADDGSFACSEIQLDNDRRTELASACGSVSGFAGFEAYGWEVRDNLIEGIWCKAGFAGSAISFNSSSAYTTIERNVIRDCVQGIVVGLYENYEPRRQVDPAPCGSDVYFDHLGGLIRNNVVAAVGQGIATSETGLDTGLGMWNVCDTVAVHNTIVSLVDTFSSIEYRFANTQARVLNNLVTHEIRDRDGAGVPFAGNALVGPEQFVDPSHGDVHLIPGSSAVDAGVQLGEDAAVFDIDGQPRDASPDIGADEL